MSTLSHLDADGRVHMVDVSEKAACVAALTLYDMLKAVDKGMMIEAIWLDAESGGKSGSWTADETAS